MLKNLKHLIAEWRKSLRQAIVTWYKAHFKAECSICHKPALLKDLKDFKRLRRVLQVCPDCIKHPAKLNRVLYSCGVCENTVTDGSLTEFRNTLLCRKCLNERSFYCPECHERVSWIRKFVTRSTVEICKHCAEKFELHRSELSEEDKAVLEKCHRKAITKRCEKSAYRPPKPTPFRVCARCGRKLACGDKVFPDSSKNTYCEHCAAKSGLVNYYLQSGSACDICGRTNSVHLLSEFDNSLLCRQCLDKYYPLCPICHQRIPSGNSFYSTFLLEYCNPCGKKLGLKRYTPPEKPAEIKEQTSAGKGQKKKSQAPREFRAELVPSPKEIPPGMSDAEVLSMMLGGKKTSWSSILSEPPPPPPPKQTFSTNNYYHPEFDDNEEDDFVLDGIGGLDGKYDV